MDGTARVWGKNRQDVINQIKDIERALPFPLRGFDVDNGSEFLNHHLLTENRVRPVQFTRTRAYHTVKRYDKLKTPYQRVLESPEITPATKTYLKEQMKTLTPLTLEEPWRRKAIFKH